MVKRPSVQFGLAQVETKDGYKYQAACVDKVIHNESWASRCYDLERDAQGALDEHNRIFHAGDPAHEVDAPAVPPLRLESPSA